MNTHAGFTGTQRTAYAADSAQSELFPEQANTPNKEKSIKTENLLSKVVDITAERVYTDSINLDV